MVFCVLGCTRATLMHSTVPTVSLSDTNNVGDSVQCEAEYLAKCEASSDTGCELVTGQSWDNGCCGQTREDVCVAVDSRWSRPLVVTLDSDTKGT